jgi:hypothetical protein
MHICLCLSRVCVCRYVLYRVSLSICVYHLIAPLVCALSRNSACRSVLYRVSLSVSITWLHLRSVLYHVTVFLGVFVTWLGLSACALSRDRGCQSVLYHVTVLVGLCLSRNLPVGLCSITWLCRFVLSRDCACRSVFITWLQLSVSAVIICLCANSFCK